MCLDAGGIDTKVFPERYPRTVPGKSSLRSPHPATCKIGYTHFGEEDSARGDLACGSPASQP